MTVRVVYDGECLLLMSEVGATIEVRRLTLSFRDFIYVTRDLLGHQFGARWWLVGAKNLALIKTEPLADERVFFCFFCLAKGEMVKAKGLSY